MDVHGWQAVMKAARFDSARMMGNTPRVGILACLLPLAFVFPAALVRDGSRALMLVAAISMFYWFMTLAGPPTLDGLGEHGAMRGLIPVSRAHQVMGRYLFMAMIAVFCAITVLWSYLVGVGALGLNPDFSGQVYVAGVSCAFLVFAAFVIPVYFSLEPAKATQILMLMFVVLTAVPAFLWRYTPVSTGRMIRWLARRVADNLWLLPMSTAVLTAVIVLASFAISLHVWTRREL